MQCVREVSKCTTVEQHNRKLMSLLHLSKKWWSSKCLLYKRLCLALLNFMLGASHNVFNFLATHFFPCTKFLAKMPVGELCFEELPDRILFISKSSNFCEQQA
uniref:Uncharacterized protein n=1 Tax=Glossina pallidipes TaxID=7398 RepID=A0A1B0AJF3_GLOPL